MNKCPTLFSHAYVTSMPSLVSSLLNSYGKSYNLKKYYSKTGKVTFFKQNYCTKSCHNSYKVTINSRVDLQKRKK